MRILTPGWLLFPLLLSGCVGQMVRQPAMVEKTARDTEAIRQEEAALEQRIASLEAQSSAQADLLREIKAGNSTQLDELSRRLAAVSSKLDDILGGHGAPAPPARLWSATPPAALIPGSAAGSSVVPPVSSMAGGDQPGAATPTDTLASGSAAPHDSATGTPAMAAVEIKRIYDQAYLDMNRGNYSLAVMGFRDYLRRSPISDLADNAQYWIGECFYAQRDFNQAIQEFLKVLNQYPQGDKVPAATLKIGYSFLQLEDHSSARRYLNQVLEQFPNSDEATLARNKLHSLGN